MVYKLQCTVLLHAYLLKTSSDYIYPAEPMNKRYSEYIIKPVIFYFIRRQECQFMKLKHFSIKPLEYCFETACSKYSCKLYIYWKEKTIYCIKMGNNSIFLLLKSYLIVNRKNTAGMMCKLSGSQYHIVWRCNHILISCWIHTGHKSRNKAHLRESVSNPYCTFVLIKDLKWITTYFYCHLVIFPFITSVTKK